MEDQEGMLASCMAASIQYRIALGPRSGQRVRRLGRMQACFYEEAELTSDRCANLGGFSLHANTFCEAWEGEKREKERVWCTQIKILRTCLVKWIWF